MTFEEVSAAAVREVAAETLEVTGVSFFSVPTVEVLLIALPSFKLNLRSDAKSVSTLTIVSEIS